MISRAASDGPESDGPLVASWCSILTLIRLILPADKAGEFRAIQVDMLRDVQENQDAFIDDFPRAKSTANNLGQSSMKSRVGWRNVPGSMGIMHSTASGVCVCVSLTTSDDDAGLRRRKHTSTSWCSSKLARGGKPRAKH